MTGEHALKQRIESAAESLELSIDEWPVVEGVLSLLAERGEWKRLARAHRLVLLRISTTSATSIGGMPRAEREPAIWRALGRILRDRLEDDASAIEVFELLARSGPTAQNADDRFELAALYEKAGRYDAALRAYDEMLAIVPERHDVYERLFQIHAHLGDVDAAWRAASALLLLEKATAAVRDFYEDYVPRLLPARRASLSEEDWAKLRDADDDPVVGEILRHARIASGRAKHRPPVDAEALAWSSDALGARYDLDAVRPSLADGARLDEPRQGRVLREHLFLAAREAACRRFPEYAVADETVPALKALFFGAVRIVKPDVPLPDALAAAATSIGATIDGALDTHEREKLRRAVAKFLADRAVVDLARWRRAAHRTRLRAALLVTGDPCGVRKLLAEPDDALSHAEVLREATAFTASARHGELRAVLGSTVGRAAAPAVPAFAPAGPARTIAEMQFVAALQPCAACSARELGGLDFRREETATGARWTAIAPCRACGATRSFSFTAKSDPTIAMRGRFNLGAGASGLLSPEELLAAFDEAVARLPAPDAITRALTCVVELLKLVPGQGPPPGAKDERLVRKTLESEYIRIKRLLIEHAPPSSVTEAMTAAHDAWLTRGAKGEGRLVLEGKRMVGERYDDAKWTLSRIADCDLTNGSFWDATFQLAELERVVLTGATVTRTSLSEARITGGTWTHADLTSLRFGGAVISGTDFTASDMERADFVDARVSDARFDGVRFGTAVFDRAIFRNCSFRGASFAKFMSKPEPTSAGAQLVDCDLTDTDWTARDLSQTTFIRCRLAGAHGKPQATEGIVLQDCDLETSAFVRQLAGEPPAPPPPKAERPLVETVCALFDGGPPRTVGALLDTLGFTLDASALEDGATGTLVSPSRALDISRPRLTARYAFDGKSEANVPTPDALRDRQLLAFSIVCLPKEAVDAALRVRFGAPTAIAGAKGDDVRVFGRGGAPGWVQTARSAVVAWYASLPEWLTTPADSEPRSAALLAILQGVREATSLDDVRAVVARLPAAGGVAPRATHSNAPDHVELVFSPPVAANVLERSLALQGVVATREAGDAWILRRLPRANEAGTTAPLSLGTWPIVPRLVDAPTGPVIGEARLHVCGPLDVVAALRIGADAPTTSVTNSRWTNLMTALVETPPLTVGELSTALGIALDGIDLAATTDRLALPALTGRFDAEGGAPATLGALRARRIVEWKATVATGFADAESVLVARFGKPVEIFGDRRYGPWAMRPADDGTPDAGHVLHRERTLTTGTSLTAVAAHPDGARIAVGDVVGRVRIWSPAEARETAYHALGARILANVWTHDGERLVVIDDRSDTLRMFSSDGTKHVGSFRTRHSSVSALAVHPSRAAVATTGTDGVVRVWDLASESTTLELDPREPDVGTAVAMSATHVAAGFRSGRFVAWELATGERVAGGAIFDANVGAMAFSPDGASLVCGGGAGSLVEIRTATWSTGSVWKGTPPKPIATNAIVFDRDQPNGRFLCAHSDDTTSLFASRVETTPERLGKLFYLDRKRWEQAYIVSGACFVPHTRIILTSHFTGRLRVWQDGDVVVANIGEVAFDHDGPKLTGNSIADAREWWAVKSPPGAAPKAPPTPKEKAPPTADIVRIGGPEHRARSMSEMEFAASLHPCATCGGPIGKTESQGGGVLVGACPFCSRVRSFVFATEGDLLGARAKRRELGDAKPSRIIRPAQLFAELARVAPAIEPEPAKLAPAAWAANSSALDRALTCLNELLKFVPADGAAIPEAELVGPPHVDGEPALAERSTRAWLTRERARLLDIDAHSLADVGRIWELRQGKLAAEDEIRATLYQAYPRVPTAADLRAYFERRRVRAVKPGANDVVVELEESAGIASARVWDDARGAHAELVMRDCTSEAFAQVLKTYGTPPELVVNERRVLIAPSEVEGDRVRRVTITFPVLRDLRDRIHYTVGNEHNPGNPFGRSDLVIERDGSARLDQYDFDRKRAWSGTVAASVLDRFWSELGKADFPGIPNHSVPAGSTIRSLYVGDGPDGKSTHIAWHASRGMPGYGVAFTILDTLIRQLSEDTVTAVPASDETMVTGITRIALESESAAAAPAVVEPPPLSPGTAFLLAYLPAHRLAIRARLDRLDRHAAGADRQLAKAIDHLRYRTTDDDSKLRAVDERLAKVAKENGVELPAPPPPSMPAGAWLASLAAAVGPRLTTPLLEAAWRAGETARRVAIAVRSATQIAHLRHAAPEHAALLAEAVAAVRGLTESAAALTTDLRATGLPLVIGHADSIQRMVGYTSNLQPTTVGGYEEMDRLVSDLDGFFETKVRHLDAPPPPEPTSPPTAEEKTLLARIVAAPADYQLRLQLAKLAELRNDPRAQLIRLQLQPTDDRDAQRAHDLVQSFPEWTAPLAALGARDVKIAGGFPHEITIDADALLAHWAELCAAAPLVRLHVRAAKARVREIVQSPRLATFELLDLDSQGVTDDDLIALAASPHVANLRQLDLRYNPIGARGIEAIAASPHLKRLEMVNLDGNPADPTDRLEYYDETNTHYLPTEAGKALEAKYGTLRWIHRG